jgi:sugar phosphate isomerase/epimerase
MVITWQRVRLRGESVNLSVSNLAFPSLEYGSAIEHLLSVGITNIEISPYKHFSGWKTPLEIKNIATRDTVNVVSMQSLFYNTNINLFADEEQFKQHFYYLFDIAKLIGCKYLVFGSPQARNVSKTLFKNRNDREIIAYFNSVIKQISKVAEQSNITIGLELNPQHYGCDFFNDLNYLEKLQFSEYVKFHFDLGCIRMLNENPFDVFKTYMNIVGNIHISEPHLNNLLDSTFEHRKFSDFIADLGYDGYISLEMKEQELDIYKKTIDKFLDFYKQ